MHKHLLFLNKSHSNLLQISYNIYGKNKFKYELIEFCEKDKLIEREQYYISLLNPSFNLQLGIINNPPIFRGKEFGTKVSEGLKRAYKEGRKRKPTSEHNRIPVVLFDEKGNKLKDFLCTRDCSIYLGFNRSRVSICLKDKHRAIKDGKFFVVKKEEEVLIDIYIQQYNDIIKQR